MCVVRVINIESGFVFKTTALCGVGVCVYTYIAEVYRNKREIRRRHFLCSGSCVYEVTEKKIVSDLIFTIGNNNNNNIIMVDRVIKI